MTAKERETTFPDDYARFQEEVPGWEVFAEPVFETGEHPENYVDFECGFAAAQLFRFKPGQILDIGSYRPFILGVLAHFPVTTLDVRVRKAVWTNERVLTGDAKHLIFPDASFDLILSLCALEHFGLGRYGDGIDGRADRQAFAEMIRVVKPGGHLVFSTTITRARPSIAFNAHRIYNWQMIQDFCSGLLRVEEKFYSHRKRGFCSLEEVTAAPREWDVYCGCWQKGPAKDGGRMP